MNEQLKSGIAANIHLAIAIHGDEAVLLPADANAPDVFSIHLGQRRVYSCKSALHMRRLAQEGEGMFY